MPFNALPLLQRPSGVNVFVKVATGALDDQSLQTAPFSQSTERKAAVASAWTTANVTTR